MHAFEANAANALVLDANVARNDLRNCTCTLAAVSRCSGATRMAGEAVATANGHGREVAQVSLDDYCQFRGLTRVGLLKIDVEGFEAEVLRGAQRVLAGRPNIALELHLDDLARYGESAGSVLALLPLQDYRGKLMVRPDWHTLCPFDGPGSLPREGVVNLFLRPV